ncbi:hypothetical protein FACS1894105_10110 [Clostridia bacterium]|nr:hypothetical protein FACS1894105_10110 [Clostridia bacterium]
MKKLALIGCGGIGGYHRGHFDHYKDVEFAATCDLHLDRAEKYAKDSGKNAAGNDVKAYQCYKKMLDEVKPDMVFIGIPPYRHGEVEFELIERGIHFFVEKPVALDVGLGIEIRDKAARADLITAVGFQCRYDNINDTALDFLKAHPIVTAQGSRIGSIPEVDWWRRQDLSGGQLTEQTVHNVDIMRYLLGDIVTVYSTANRGFIKTSECPGYDTDDYTTTIFTFSSGITATMLSGCYATGPAFESKTVFSARDARLDYYLIDCVKLFGVDAVAPTESAAGIVKGDGMQFRKEGENSITVKTNVDVGTVCDRTFVDAVLTGDNSKIRSPYSDGLKTVAACLASNESIKTGLPVKVLV